MPAVLSSFLIEISPVMTLDNTENVFGYMFTRSRTDTLYTAMVGSSGAFEENAVGIAYI